VRAFLLLFFVFFARKKKKKKKGEMSGGPSVHPARAQKIMTFPIVTSPPQLPAINQQTITNKIKKLLYRT
jgi:hypothetical protein